MQMHCVVKKNASEEKMSFVNNFNSLESMCVTLYICDRRMRRAMAIRIMFFKSK